MFYIKVTFCCISYKHFLCRNLQKTAKKRRYEHEKAVMGTLRSVRNVVGTYVGIHLDSGDECQQNSDWDLENCISDKPENSKPFRILYECETTVLSIYADHIVDIAPKVLNSSFTISSNFQQYCKIRTEHFYFWFGSF